MSREPRGALELADRLDVGWFGSDFRREVAKKLRLLENEVGRLSESLQRIFDEVAHELPCDDESTGIQRLAHTVSVIALSALAERVLAEEQRGA